MDGAIRLAILGAGNIRCSPPVVAALATYFGERPLEIRLYDADEERLDLIDRFARHCFVTNKTTHELLYRTDPSEALEKVDRILLQVDPNCAGLLVGEKPSGEPSDAERVSRALGILLEGLPSNVEVLSLQKGDVAIPVGIYRRLDWPGEQNEDQVRWMPHQILRWIRGDEAIFDLLSEHERSPLKLWLDDPNSAELVVNRSAGL